LDAIQGEGDHQALLQTIMQRYAHLSFWVDSGFQQAPGVYQGIANHLPVLGSESYTQQNYLALEPFAKRFILSLDYSATAALGAPELFASDALWPEQVLIMSLPRVGSQDGPDLPRLQAMIEQYPQQAFIAAGGIRYFADLQHLKNIGVGTALVASALHSGALNTEDLQQLQAA
jgi:phosphoribosylformimino-5-aminoimidazole carboxamide ribotide isomerase